MKKMKLPLTVAGILALSALPAFAAVVTSELNLRRGPGTNYNVIASMPAGARVRVGPCTGNWCKVGWRGHRGYAAAGYISGERRISREHPRWRASAATRTAGIPQTTGIPRIWGYGFTQPRKTTWPIFGSVIAPDFSTAPPSTADTSPNLSN